jgi:hypothetical protein
MGIFNSIFGRGRNRREEPLSLDDLEELPGSKRYFRPGERGSPENPFELPPLPGEPGSPENPFSLDDEPPPGARGPFGDDDDDGPQLVANDPAADYRNFTFTPLSSSNLYSVAYSPDTLLLWIYFHKDGVIQSLYEYCGVPQGIYIGLLSAGSAGTYHRDHIRCTYRYSMLQGQHELDQDCYARTQDCIGGDFHPDPRAN